MTEQHCFYPDREAAIVAYLYDEIDGVGRVAFETHVTACEPCRSELADLRGVRSTLAQWVAPETVRSRQSAAVSLPSRWWQAVPVWAQVAAAILVLGVSASVANLDVRYDRANGLRVTTGWTKPVPAPQPQVADATPWRAELAAMKKQLHDEMRTQSTATATASAGTVMSDTELRRRVNVLLDESERKQEKQLALQIVQLQQDLNVQRQSDLGQVYRALGLFQNTTRGELLNQRQALRMAVSQTK
jgi:hypothetical protein